MKKTDKALAMIGACVVIAFFVIFCGVVFGLLLAFPFKWIWNYAIIAALTVAKPIGYWHAFWLMWFIVIFIMNSNLKKSKN